MTKPQRTITTLLAGLKIFRSIVDGLLSLAGLGLIVGGAFNVAGIIGVLENPRTLAFLLGLVIIRATESVYDISQIKRQLADNKHEATTQQPPSQGETQ